MTISRHYVWPLAALAGTLFRHSHWGRNCSIAGIMSRSITDQRGTKIPGCPDKIATHVLPAGRITKNPTSWLPGVKAIAEGPLDGAAALRSFAPSAVIGFGGYPAFPALLGAFAEKNPDDHPRTKRRAGPRQPFHRAAGECNCYRLSRHLRLSPRYRKRCIWSAIRCVRKCWPCAISPIRPCPKTGIFRVLVTGGSQGATILSEVVPDGLSRLPLNLRRRLQVTQQCRAEDIETVRAAAYAQHDIPAELATYLPDLPERLGLGASGDIAGRGIDNCRADLRGSPRDIGAAAQRDRQSPKL